MVESKWELQTHIKEKDQTERRPIQLRDYVIHRRNYLITKRVFDVVVSALLLLSAPHINMDRRLTREPIVLDRECIQELLITL